ncbi:hypothetical protein [Fibrivirga algicola]|uniref:Lipocalin-like domain-containing protein n=1 Tax=Fibrivirga algicola TaxID=2950420 RepID=A0ABX0QMY7_9BACT|nr:hypothetical protein [Fibrivirga algicola]NID12227.1 hypothetical protein [Fibrivirga algicola]
MRITQLASKRLAFVLFMSFVGLVSCKKDDEVQTTAVRSELLVANNWRLSRITDQKGDVIAVNRLGVSALALNFADIQFTDKNVARAIDRSTKQIINGGTWYLVQNNAALDINVTGFAGIFPILELTRTKLTIQQTTTVDGQKTDVNLEFAPSI